MVEFIKDFRFDALGVFPYSREADTPAGRMRGQVPEAVKEQRVDALMRTQQEIAFQLAEERVGSTFDVLVDGREDDERVSARHQGQAPMVDSVTYVRGNASPGEFATVRCVARNAYDLVAVATKSALPIL